MAAHRIENPLWTIVLPAAGIAALGAIAMGYSPSLHAGIALVVALLLGGSVFAAVHHAELIAARVGEPLGSIVLALAVTVLEVGLILSLMVGAGEGGETIARDTVYSAIMIITTAIVGLSLLLGSRHHFEQTIRIRGTSSALSVLSVLAVITLILPNFTIATYGPTFSNVQLLMVAITSLCLYCTFLFVQTVRHRDYFLPEGEENGDENTVMPTSGTLATSAAMLCVSLLAVILLAKSLSPVLADGITGAGLPVSFTGVIIAAMVLLPEGIAAVRAAIANRLQVSVNLALGSGLATIGLTIPAVAMADLLAGYNIALGVSPSQTVLLVLALFVSAVTLSNGRTNILSGVVHLSIFAMFLLISAVP
ncbi:MAG: ionic transporter y4hA [Rhizobiales bacterium]|nr:ionic transporter y4hA [Hyphomicrobiales bacterium]